MSKFIRVNRTLDTITQEPVPDSYAMLGGRGLTSTILSDEVDPLCHPLEEGNKLILAPGLFTGTKAPSSGRLSVGAKSPHTGGIKESNGGGTAARKLARLGIKALIIEGKPKTTDWSILKITSESIELLPAGNIVGMGNFEATQKLQEIYGTKPAVIIIGQGGEMQLGTATVAVSDMDGLPNRHCGRGGMGAVMGSKGIKAVVIDDSGASEGLLDVADKTAFGAAAKDWAKQLSEGTKALHDFGTAVLVNPISQAGGLPTRNFSEGNFEHSEHINGQNLTKTINERGGKVGHGCSPGCVIRCSNVFHDADGNYLVSALEYETLALMGSNLGIDSLDAIARMNRLCNDYGVDTMEVGVAIGVAMDAGMARFGDSASAIDLLNEIPKGTLMGRLIGQGATTTGKVLGISHVPAVKGQAMSGYDPRALKGTGITYATSTMGGDHTAGNCLPGRGGLDPNLPDGQVELSRDLQIMSAAVDNMGLCLFVGPLPGSMEHISKLITAALGREFTVEQVLDIGKKILKHELNFNHAAGFTKAHDRLPEFFKTEQIGPKQLVFDVDEAQIDQVMNF